MKNSNIKTSLTRKAAAITSAVMTLSTVTILAMAPMSEAQAVGLFKTGGDCSKSGGVCSYRAEGGGRSAIDAQNDAYRRVQCPRGTEFIPSFSNGASGSMYNKTWYYFDVNFRCKYKMRASPRS